MHSDFRCGVYNHSLAQKSSQRGVGIIEVLIAVVLLSIGFLATAKMQVNSMSSSSQAYALTQARFMVTEMSERMRANRAGLLGGHYRNKRTKAGLTEPLCKSVSTPCNPAQLANADFAAWSANLYPTGGSTLDFTPALPSSDSIDAIGFVTYSAATDVYTINVQWAESDGGNYIQRTLQAKIKP